MKYKCHCCGYYTLEEKPNGSYEICPVCFWEDDPIQLYEPNLAAGANPVSLLQARDNFLEYGACEKEMISHTRKPNTDELSGID